MCIQTALEGSYKQEFNIQLPTGPVRHLQKYHIKIDWVSEISCSVL